MFNDMTTTTQRKTFARLISSQAVSEYLTEAKRVNYRIAKDSDSFAVWTDECENHPAGELVFKGLKKDSNTWIVGFNTAYWQEDK
jgi:hypothetical protein